MKCVFATNDVSVSTYPLLKTAINSLQANTKLTPIVLWSGSGNDMTDWLKKKNVEVIHHKLSFDVSGLSFKNIHCPNQMLENMYKNYPDYYNDNFIYTASLRMDIPIIFDDDWVLYCDCDTLFLKDPEPLLVKDSNCYLGAFLREDRFFNNGVLFFNMPKMRECYKEFIDYYLASNFMFKIGNTGTQGLYNSFFVDKPLIQLGEKINWHVFWGYNANTYIAHFCGPKPDEYGKLKKEFWELHNRKRNEQDKYEVLYYKCIRDSMENGWCVERYIEEWNKYAESPVSIS